MPKSKRGGKGLLIILSGPSGVGKSTIVKSLLKIDPRLAMSVSCTTRAPRHGEKNKKDYFFLSRKAFREKIDAGGFLEWAEVHGELYGTPKDFIEKCIVKNRSVVLEVDVQGAGSIKESLLAGRIFCQAVFIFVIPPSVDILAFRLKRRRTENQEVLNNRLKTAIAELKVMEKYDYIVVNDRVEHAAKKISAIIKVEKERMMIN